MADGREIAAAYIALVPTARGIQSNLESELRDPAKRAGQQAGQALEEGITTGSERAGRKAATLLASTLASGVVLRGINQAKDAASGLQQAVGGTEAVFGEASEAIDRFSEKSAELAGLSSRQAREFTSQLGASLKGYGFAVDEAADKSVELTQLGADLSATFGGSVPDAVTALAAALRGEFDPLERYGVALRASDISARAVADGLATSESSVSNYAKAQSALAIILEQTAGAQGQFGREADSAAGKAAIGAAKTEDAAASLGDSLLPIYARISDTVGTVADVFAALPGPVQTGVVALAGIAAVSGPVANTVGLMRTLRPATTEAATALTSASRAASNSADSVGDLYTNTGRASGAMRGLAAAGGALAAIGLAAALYEIATAATEVSVDVDKATRATTSALVAGFQEVERTVGRGFAEDAFADLVAGGEAGVTAAVELRDALAATGADVTTLDRILADAAEGEETFANRTHDGADALARYGYEAPAAGGAVEEFSGDVVTAEDVLAGFNRSLEDGASAFTDYFDAASSDDEALINFRDSLRDIEGLHESVNDGTLKGQERVDEFARHILDGRDAILAYAEQLIQSGVPLDQVTTKVNGLVDQLFEQADQAGLTKDEVATLREELGLMPSDISIAIDTTLGKVAEDMAAFNEQIAIALRYAAETKEKRLRIVNDRLLGRAEGGPVHAGESYVIGEQGVPEIFTPNVNGFVTPLDVFSEAPAATGSPLVGGDLVVQQLPGEDAGEATLRGLRKVRLMAGA